MYGIVLMLCSLYSYVPYDPNMPHQKSQFTCAMVDDFTLEALIWHGLVDGVGCDTSYRNKSENRAAVTFLIAVDESLHLVPGRFSCQLSRMEY
jgi:hypothetical protein